MAPSKRERDDARRRYAEHLRRQEQQAAARRRRNRVLVLVGAVFAVALVAAGVVTAVTGGDDTTEASGPCPTPTSGAVADPPQFDAAPAPGSSDATSAVIATTCGDITVELLPDAAPQAVASFAFLADEGFFAGTPCHRLVTSGIFVLQCGDPTGTGTGGPGYSFGPVENAPADDVYPAGTLAMARQGGDGDSNGSQFFLVYEDSSIPSDAGGGYTVFGRVTEGLDVVQTIAEGGTAADGVAPARPISIEGVTTQ
ncbi:peptidylprolyl isomerase [Pseudokineococcus marinus]|uniref:Peptidylprolyl isomerase n=1 Tax=Pseudokineococcus marinus TaxID=351215 RepID=A0A849BMT4_9ACTN|nr:peptidylprolyl isomerase [Pseudokineococcus marinus]NNH22357.1 peptidylprolyl isomerase [Pseudokineococcus marinus]